MARLTRYHGTACPYCERTMDINSIRLRPTRDHIVPRIKGGRETIVCCGYCNSLKGHMMPQEWDTFRAAFPGYWKLAARDRRLALAKHNREYVPIKGQPIKRLSKPVPRARRAAIVVPPELIYLDAQLRTPTKQPEETIRPLASVGAGGAV